MLMDTDQGPTACNGNSFEVVDGVVAPGALHAHTDEEGSGSGFGRDRSGGSGAVAGKQWSDWFVKGNVKGGVDGLLVRCGVMLLPFIRVPYN